MKILHLTNSYTLPEKQRQEIYKVTHAFSDYKTWITRLQKYRPDIVHVHGVGSETLGMYALIARFRGIRVVQTLHTPTIFSYLYIVRQLCFRFFYAHTICTSKYIAHHVDRLHLSSRSRRSVIYTGVDEHAEPAVLSKQSARAYIYKNLGISFTKNIRIIGTILENGKNEKNNGVEHFIDAAYLAENYKNLTNTIFIILCRGVIPQDLKIQIEELKIHGICLYIENTDNAMDYIKAFDIYISPRVEVGDLYKLINILHAGVSSIVTKVGDTIEFDQYTAVNLVPPGSAKFLTEAIMYVIKNDKILSKSTQKISLFPKKFTADNEYLIIQSIYKKICR